MVVGQHTFNLYSYRTNKLTLLSISSITPGQTKGFKEIGLNHSIRLIIGTVPLQGMREIAPNTGSSHMQSIVDIIREAVKNPGIK